ncbi:MAG: branched-chain amino acid transaminase [Gemmatimonadales bacterium]|nr:MAG: branched-chain amino acid transaminase [Gemmatimonadales bacterium]
MSGRISESEWIWKDGEFIPWADAQLHLLSTAVQFGTSVFEGIRAYQTPRGPAVFRLGEHIRRLQDSCRIYRLPLRHDASALHAACVETVRKNDLGDCYIRPMVLRGYGAAGLYAEASPLETYVAAWPWGTYLGEGALEKGVDVCTSSWLRAHPNTFPVAAKAAGHYVSAQLIKMEAVANGYTEGIALGPGGLVSEGSGQNLFLVRDRTLITPFLDGTSLSGITRDAILQLAEDVGVPVREQLVPRESLYTADEMFFTGTASEVTPIRSVDRIEVGTGKAGPVTLMLQKAFMDVVKGRVEDRHDWLTRVD